MLRPLVRLFCRFIVLSFFLIVSTLAFQLPVLAQAEPLSPLPDTFQVVEINGSSLLPSPVITDTGISLREIIEAWERADVNAGIADERQEPYSIIGVALTPQRSSLFLPFVTDGSDDTTTATAQVWLGEGGRPLTPEEIEANLEISRQYEAISRRDLKALQEKVDAVSVQAAGTEQTGSILATTYVNKSLGGLSGIKETNNYLHRNYCGPGAITVALDAMWQSEVLPNMDAIAITIGNYQGTWTVNGVSYPHFHPDVGTSGYGLCRYVHDYFKNNFAYRYMASGTSISATDNQDLWRKTAAHIDRNYALVTGTNTSYLSGWSRRPGIAHIVSVIGYESNITGGWYHDMRSMRYAETSGTEAGYDGGSFKIWINPATFIAGVRYNNIQCVLDPSVY